MSRYHDPEGMGGDPSSGERRAGNRGMPGDPGLPRRRLAFLGPHPILAAAAILSTVLVVGVSLVAYAAVRNVYDGINHEAVTAQMLGNRPPKLNGSTNILLIGSDSRAGTDGKFGRDVLGARSDTTMVLHIAPDHSHAYVISFPRDSMVPIYNCLPDQQGHPGQTAQAAGVLEPLNATFSDGGAPCLWKTLEQTTHIHIDHFVEVGFNSFKAIVNDVHGINVCLPFAINNAQAHLHLAAGRHKVYGAQALAFVRLRENIGDGSDLQRIQRQQLFLASAMQKIKQTNLLGDYKVIKDAADAVTTDLSLTDMLGIANSMKGLNTSAVRFISVPVVHYLRRTRTRCSGKTRRPPSFSPPSPMTTTSSRRRRARPPRRPRSARPRCSSRCSTAPARPGSPPPPPPAWPTSASTSSAPATPPTASATPTPSSSTVPPPSCPR